MINTGDLVQNENLHSRESFFNSIELNAQI